MSDPGTATRLAVVLASAGPAAAQGGPAFCAALALEWGIRYEREYIAWATQARDRIAAGANAWNDARERRLEGGTATA